jgi:hypothetical protein
MDQDAEIRKFKMILVAGLAFLFSAYSSWQELKFAMWGTTAEARVTRTFDTAERRRPLLAVEYTFEDRDGRSHSERDDLPASFPDPGDVVTVEYLPGVEDSSRIEGHSSMASVWVFLACLGWLGYSAFKLYREASEAVHGGRRR